MELKVIECGIDESGVACVRLNRPGRGNSWSGRMNAEYRWLISQLEADPKVRVIVVTGAGRQFCVGADFKALDHYSDTGADYAESVRHTDDVRPGHGIRPEYDHDIVWQWGLAKPLIAAINGACAGIAVAIAAFCDFRYAAAGAKITTASPRLGLPAEYGLGWLLPRIVGLTHAADMLMTGRIVLAEEARAMGFVNEVFPVEEFHDRVMERARSLATSVSPRAFAVTKRQLYAELMSGDVGEAVEESKRLISVLMRDADFREGAAALQEKRPAKFLPLDGDAALPPVHSASAR